MSISDAYKRWAGVASGLASARAVAQVLIECTPGPGCTVDESNLAADLAGAILLCLDAAQQAYNEVPAPD